MQNTIKDAIVTTAKVLLVIWVAQKVSVTRPFVQKALNGL